MPPWRWPSLNHQVISDGPHVALGKIKTKIKEELSYCDHIQQVLILFLSLPSYLNGPSYVFFGAALSNKWLNSCYLCSFLKILSRWQMYAITMLASRLIGKSQHIGLLRKPLLTLQSLAGRELTLGGEGRETHYEDPRTFLFTVFLALYKACVLTLGAATRSLTFGPQVCLWSRPRWHRPLLENTKCFVPGWILDDQKPVNLFKWLQSRVDSHNVLEYAVGNFPCLVPEIWSQPQAPSITAFFSLRVCTNS